MADQALLRDAARPPLADLIDGAEGVLITVDFVNSAPGASMRWRPNYPAPSLHIGPTLPARPSTEETTTT